MAVALAHNEVVQLTLSSTGTWETVDVSLDCPSLPADAAGVMLVVINSSSSEGLLGIREGGNTAYTQTAYIENHNRQAAYAALNSNYEIDVYRAGSNYDVYLIGYFTSDYSEVATPVDITLSSTGSDQNVDVSAYAPLGAKFAVVELTGPDTRGGAFAYTGDGTNFEGYSNAHLWALVPLDANDTFNCQLESVIDQTLYLIGFVTAGTVRTTKGADLFAGIVTTGSYQTIALPDSGQQIAVIEVVSNQANRMFDLAPTSRTNWPAVFYDDAYDNTGTDIVSIDGSNQASAKIEDLSTEAHCWGYLEAVSTRTTLAVADATHAHSADNVSLIQHHSLAVNDANHAQSVDGLTLTYHAPAAVPLVVGDAVHGHTADAVVFTQHHQLAVDPANHAQVADAVVLTQQHNLSFDDAAHVHQADAVVLTPHAPGGVQLVVGDAAQAHQAEAVALTQQQVLAVAGALHAMRADAVNFDLPRGAVRLAVSVAVPRLNISAAAPSLNITVEA